MKNLLTQIKNEWRSNLFLLVELLLVFAVLWYIVDWVTVTARVYRAPMGFDTEHCYNLSFSTLTSKSALYNPELTVEDNIDALLVYGIVRVWRLSPFHRTVTLIMREVTALSFICRIVFMWVLTWFGLIRISIVFSVIRQLMEALPSNWLLLFPTKP